MVVVVVHVVVDIEFAVGGCWWWINVIFMSNPTFFLLGCVEVVTITFPQCSGPSPPFPSFYGGRPVSSFANICIDSSVCFDHSGQICHILLNCLQIKSKWGIIYYIDGTYLINASMLIFLNISYMKWHFF